MTRGLVLHSLLLTCRMPDDVKLVPSATCILQHLHGQFVQHVAEVVLITLKGSLTFLLIPQQNTSRQWPSQDLCTILPGLVWRQHKEVLGNSSLSLGSVSEWRTYLLSQSQPSTRIPADWSAGHLSYHLVLKPGPHQLLTVSPSRLGAEVQVLKLALQCC